MTVLEATIEIVKASLEPATQSTNISCITDNESRAMLLKGIEDIYKKLEELEKDKEAK